MYKYEGEINNNYLKGKNNFTEVKRTKNPFFPNFQKKKKRGLNIIEKWEDVKRDLALNDKT